MATCKYNYAYKLISLCVTVPCMHQLIILLPMVVCVLCIHVASMTAIIIENVVREILQELNALIGH